MDCLLPPRILTVGRFASMAALASLCLLTACSRGSSSTNSIPSEKPPEPVFTGEQPVTGLAPDPHSGLPAIVVLTPRKADGVSAPTHVPAMDQVSRTFVPSILFVRTGHPAEFRNSDTDLHNVNVKDAVTREQAFNVAVGTDEKYVHTFQRDGVFDVSCDVHAGMTAQIVVASTPYVTLAGQDGRFSFPKVAGGVYDVTVYAGVQTIERTIEIAGAPTDLDLR